jgi:uncharacterized protein
MSTTLLRAVEYHRFAARDRLLLFAVAAMEVIPSIDLDETILKHAEDGITEDELIAAVASDAEMREAVVERIATLRETRFLLAEGEEPVVAPAGHSTTYATFMVNVSQRCNLTCPYCYVNKGLFDYEEKPIARMSAVTADGIVNRIHANFPGFQIYGYHFYGGEPLMNFDAIRRIVGAAENKATDTGTRADYHITTNGTLLTREIADFMDAHRFTVYFSIDGDEEHHNELRKYVNGGGSYEDVERNLAYLRTKPGVHLIGSSVIRKGFNLGEAIELLDEHGARQCKAERVRLHDGDDLSLQGDDHDTYIRDIEAMFDHYVERLNARRKPMDFRLSSKILQLLTRTRRDFFCPAAERMFGISSNGELYPCALHVGRPQSKMGDVFNGIDREKQQAFRAKFSAQNQAVCKTCWNRTLCGGGCSAMVDRFGHEDCRSLMAESECAISIFQHVRERDETLLYGLVSPKIAKWVNGELEDEAELLPNEPAAEKIGLTDNCACGGHCEAST